MDPSQQNDDEGLLQSSLFSACSSRKESMTTLYHELHSQNYVYLDAGVAALPSGSAEQVKVEVTILQQDLKRYEAFQS